MHKYVFFLFFSKTCPCTDDACISNRAICMSPKLQSIVSSLTTDFRKEVFSKHEDILLAIFDFEKCSIKKIEDGEKKINALRRDIDLMKSKAHQTFSYEDTDNDQLIATLDVNSPFF